MIKKICLILLILFFSTSAFASRIQLTWEEGSSDTTGFIVYAGINPGVYILSYDVGPLTKVLSPKWWPARRYYFVVTAYDKAGNESLPTYEVTCKITEEKYVNRDRSRPWRKR